MRLAIVIVTYNARDWLGTSLRSCREYAPEVPVYAVDNASSDGTADGIRKEYPQAQLLVQSTNLGFAPGTTQVYALLWSRGPRRCSC